MITTKKLCKLIASLDPNEKRYFKSLSDRLDGAKSQYLILYKLIDDNIDLDEHGDPYCTLDEEALTYRMVRKKIETQFHVVRYQLANNLLRALRWMQEESNEEDVIRNQIKNAQLLEYRGIADWASEMAADALESARKFEYHALAIEALQKLVYLRSQRDAYGYTEKIESYLGEIEHCAQQQNSDILLFALWHQSFLLYRTRKGILSPDLKFEINALLQHATLASERPPDSFLGKIRAFQSRAVLADLEAGKEAAQPWFAKILLLWESEEYKHMQKEQPRMYIIHLSNYLIYCIATQKFEEYKRYNALLKDIKASNSDQEAELFQNRRFIRQLYYLNTAKLDKAIKMVPGIEHGLKKYAFKINKSRLFSFRHHIILSYFLSEDYQTALDHCDTLLQYGKSEQRRDLQFFTKILREIFHFEVENFDALDNFVRRTKPTLIQADQQVRDFERIVLRNVVCLADAYVNNYSKNGQTNQKIFTVFLDELKQFKSSKPPQIPLGFEEIQLWVKSKLTGKTILDLLLE